MMGIKVPDNQYFKSGRELHRIIQDHVSGKSLHPHLRHIEITFPIVEEVEFDPRCKKNVQINDKYQLFTLVDGHDPDNRRFLEIKTGSKMYSVGQFQSLMQRKLYSLAYPEYTESVLITASSVIDVWDMIPPRRYSVPLTKKDREEAMQYVLDAIAVIEKGDFTGGLENGKCVNRFCAYGVNCQYK